MVQDSFVGAADIHAVAPAYGFEAFENLDVLGGIAGILLLSSVLEEICHGAIIEGARWQASACSGSNRLLLQYLVFRRGNSMEGASEQPRGELVLRTVAMPADTRSEEHTSELQSLMRIPYAGF